MKKAKKGDVVKVHYTGMFEDGKVFDSSKGKEPLEFKVGEGRVIKGFDSAVEGMSEGEKKSVKIEPKEAYGDKNPQLIQKVPRKQFPKDMKLEPGVMLNLKHPMSQQPIPVMVVDANDEEVTIDLNHPLSGKNLKFDIELVSINS